MDIYYAVIKLVIFLPITVGCIYLLGKFYGKTAGVMGRNMKVLEMTQLSKDNSLAIVKVGEEILLISSSNGRVELLKELDKESLDLHTPNVKPTKFNIAEFLKKGDKNEK